MCSMSIPTNTIIEHHLSISTTGFLFVKTKKKENGELNFLVSNHQP